MNAAVNAGAKTMGDAVGTTHQLLVCDDEVTATLVSSAHGYDDYDLIGKAGSVQLRRICIPHSVKFGDRVNVYLDESSKRGAAWRGSLQKTLDGFIKEPGHEGDLRRYVCSQCNAGGADRRPPVVCHGCGARESFRLAVATNDAAQAHEVEVAPALVEEKLASVMMQDVVGDYEEPSSVPEWTWIEQNASFAHRDNGTAGVHDFVLNLARTFNDVPDKLRPVMESAKRNGISYLLFHQGT